MVVRMFVELEILNWSFLPIVIFQKLLNQLDLKFFHS